MLPCTKRRLFARADVSSAKQWRRVCATRGSGVSCAARACVVEVRESERQQRAAVRQHASQHAVPQAGREAPVRVDRRRQQLLQVRRRSRRAAACGVLLRALIAAAKRRAVLTSARTARAPARRYGASNAAGQAGSAGEQRGRAAQASSGAGKPWREAHSAKGLRHAFASAARPRRHATRAPLHARHAGARPEALRARVQCR